MNKTIYNSYFRVAFFLSLLLIGYSDLTSQDNHFFTVYRQLETNQKDSVEVFYTHLANIPDKTPYQETQLNLYTSLIKSNLDNKSALPFLIKGLKESEDYGFQDLEMYFSYLLGRTTNPKHALEYFKRALSIAHETNNEECIAHSNLAIGSIRLMQFQESSSSFNSHLKEVQYPDSIGYLIIEASNLYINALRYFKKSGEIDNQIKVYNNLGSLHLLTDEPKKSKLYFDSLILVAENQKDPEIIGKGHLNYGIYHYYNGNYKATIRELTTASEYIPEESDYYQSILLANLSYAYEELGNYKKAYENLDLSIYHQNKYQNNQLKRNQLMNTLTDQVIEQSNNEILEANERAAKSKRRTRLILFTFLGISTIAGILFYTLLRNARLKRENLELAMKTTQLENSKKLKEKEQEIQDKIINATVEAKEQERKEIAEILHNSISANLSSANLHLHALKKYGIETYPEIDKAKTLIEHAGNDLRRLSHNLFSPILMKFGLMPAVKNLTELYSNQNITFLFDNEVNDQYSIPNHLVAKAYLIVTELCQNIIKHSKADKAWVYIDNLNNTLTIRVSDNGIGIERDITELDTGGMGITQIISIVRAQKGKMDISRKDNKTVIETKIPISL